MDWLQLASGLGIGGAVGALIGAVSAAKSVQGDLGSILESLKKGSTSDAIKKIENLPQSADRLNQSIDLLKRSLTKKSCPPTKT